MAAQQNEKSCNALKQNSKLAIYIIYIIDTVEIIETSMG